MNISALGDSALLIDFADEFSNPDALLHRALAAAEALERAKIPGIAEITSAYQSVALFLHRTQPDSSSLLEQISALLASHHALRRRRHRTIEIPVCYDSDFALDASRVSEKTSLPLDMIARLHSSTEFTVACLGFMPGFPYLVGLPKELHLPRLSTPRTKVAAGSVAIANTQAGIYPFESPGGWNIIGRTPTRLFNANKTPPALLAAGDRVRFVQITRDEFEAANEK